MGSLYSQAISSFGVLYLSKQIFASEKGQMSNDFYQQNHEESLRILLRCDISNFLETDQVY